MPLHSMNNKWASKGLVPNDRLLTVRAAAAVRAFRALVIDSVVDGVLLVKEYDGNTNVTRPALGFAYTAAGQGDEFVLIALGPIVKGVIGSGETATAGGAAGVDNAAGGLVKDITLAPDGTVANAFVGWFLQDGTAGDVVQIMLTGNGLANV